MLPNLARLRLVHGSAPTSGTGGGPDGTPSSEGSGPAARALADNEDVLRMIIDKARRDGPDDVPLSKRVDTDVSLTISRKKRPYSTRPVMILTYTLSGPTFFPQDATEDEIYQLALEARPKVVRALVSTLAANRPYCEPPQQPFTFDTLLTTSTARMGTVLRTSTDRNKEFSLQCALSSRNYSSEASSEAECLFDKLAGDGTDHIEFAVHLTNNILAALGMIGYEDMWRTVRRESVPIRLVGLGNPPGQIAGRELILQANLDTVRIEDVPFNELLNASDMPSRQMREVLESLRAQQAMLTQN